MIVCQRCLRKNADAASVCANCGSPLMSDWVAAGRPFQGNQTAWPVAPPGTMGEPAPETISRSPFQTAGAAGPLAADPRWAWVETGYERQPTPPVASRDPRRPAPRLSIRLPTGESIALVGRTSYLIGRRDSSGVIPDVDLTDLDGAAAGVSRRHAVIYAMDGAYYIEDLRSHNETIHNRARLVPGQRYLLADGDRLVLGLIELQVALT